MIVVDAWLLDLTERCCRRFQMLTGRTNIWLAVQLTNVSIIVYFVSAGVTFWVSGLASRLLIGVFCTVLLYALMRTVLKVPIETYESSVYHRVAKGLRNPRRVRDVFLRISFLTLMVVLYYPIAFVYMHLRIRFFLLIYLLIALTTVVLYLLACDPLPPCAGTVREWFRRFVLRPAPSTGDAAYADADRSNLPVSGLALS
jgi:hypothetical protein